MNAVIVTGVSDAPIDVAAFLAKIKRTDCGGLVSFEGSTRSPDEGRAVLELSYEAYESRALSQLDALAREAALRWGLCGVVAVHRIGSVAPGEPSVLVAASAPHRAEAFDAARWLIDTIKATVAVWKKEIFADGERWVGSEDRI